MPPESLTPPRAPAASKRSTSSGSRAVNSNHTAAAADGYHELNKRAGVTGWTPNWGLTYMSVPPKTGVLVEANGWVNHAAQLYKYQFDSPQCDGQYVYVVENQFDKDHPVRSWSPCKGLKYCRL
jgi:hypothetical protein